MELQDTSEMFILGRTKSDWDTLENNTIRNGKWANGDGGQATLAAISHPMGVG